MAVAGAHFGIGRHIDTVSDHEQEEFFRVLYAYNQIYIATGPVIKIAVLLMYQRVFDIAPFRLTARILGAIIVTWWLGEALTGILTCIPVQAYWELALQKEPGTKCINLEIFDIQYAVLNIFFDLVLLALPVRMVLRLQLSGAQKLGFVVIFLLGGLYGLPSSQHLRGQTLIDCRSTAIAALIRLLTAILNINNADYTCTYIAQSR